LDNLPSIRQSYDSAKGMRLADRISIEMFLLAFVS